MQFSRSLYALFAFLFTLTWMTLPASAQRVRLKDGRILQGKMLYISGVDENVIEVASEDSDPKATPILLINDDLRRTFVPKLHLAEVIDQAPDAMARIKIPQNVSRAGNAMSSVGPSLGITAFDEYGRRIYEMQTRKGPLAIVQGITLLTPRYVKVEGLLSMGKSVVWDQRLATSSIPRETLAKILAKAVSKDDPQSWLQIVRFYLQSERYRDARRELESIIERYPEMEELQAEVSQLRQMGARRILKEIQLRREAGQHELAGVLLANFPAEEVAGETLQQVRETLEQYENQQTRVTRIAELLSAFVSKIRDPDHRDSVQMIVKEISANLSFNNIDRLASLEQLADDESLSADEKAALAITGWMLGRDGALQDLSVAVSLVTVRKEVRRYLNEPLAHKRIELLDAVRSREGASVQRVAQLLAHMVPPWEIPEGASQGHGVYELRAPGKTESGDFRYTVQLPPEYDPYRHYPTLVALCGAYNSPEQELNFWAGVQQKEQSEGAQVVRSRRGQAMRHGYITIAVDWLKPQQKHYEYSLREHEAVLTVLRDACRRFSVDTNRVFLSGHGVGGDAAWDFAQAHPDLWAGVIPFVASAKKYVPHYWENAGFVPLYFVAGELDGLKMARNAKVFDQYMRKRFDTTVVEFLGRGQEPFHDEILNLFDWMGRHHRGDVPREFACNTMRPWDNFFWWVEGQGFPGTVQPANWPQRGARPTLVEGKVLKANRLAARTASEQTTFWLSPDLVDFEKPIRITLNGRKVTRANEPLRPDLTVLLEDVRTRGDRQRPFWAKLEVGR